MQCIELRYQPNKKKLKAQRNRNATTFKTLVRNATSAIAEVALRFNLLFWNCGSCAIAEVALCASNCTLPTSDAGQAKNCLKAGKFRLFLRRRSSNHKL